MTLNARLSLIAKYRFLASLLIALSALSGIANAQNPVPLINQPLVPDTAIPGGKGFTLTVNGTGFVSGSTVNWNGSALATTFVSASLLRASVPASNIAKAGTASVTVVNPGPEGRSSNVVFSPIALPGNLVFGTSAFSGGTAPWALAVGDFNGDGKLDLAVTNNTDNTVSILAGNGDGSVKLLGTATTGQSPQGITAADFNGDGKLDLAVADSGSGTVSILLGRGDGTFEARQDYGTGQNPQTIVVADVNGDGKLDLAVANYGPGFENSTVSILLGNGDGTFQPQVAYAAGVNPVGVLVGDFNRDGKLDLAVLDNNAPFGISILLGNGDGSFGNPVLYPAGNNSRVGMAADFNADGKLDLAVANYTDNDVSILFGNGDGSFQAPVNYPVGGSPNALTGADFNGDGKLDLVTANQTTNSISVLQGNGNGTFQAHVDYPAGPGPSDIAAGDFNGDGRLDLAVPNMNGDTVSVFLEGGAVTLNPPSLNFGTQVVETRSPLHKVVLTNVGSKTLNISSIAVTGNDFFDFHQNNNCPPSLPARAHCTISVTFTPTQRGHREGTVTITDNAPYSPQKVSLKGIGTVVELNPASLDLGKVKVGQKSSPQNTRLTNLGNTKLHITEIAITGADPWDFSQMNNCPKYLDGGESCTITVTFQPTQRGSRSADVSVRDDGGGSPQQVSLAGAGCIVIHNRCKTDGLSGAPVRSALAAYPISAVPSPTGPGSVGTRVVDLVDSTRNDPFLANGAKRELLVRFWYPASLDRGCAPAQYTSPRVWSYFSELVGIPLPEVRTNSCLNAPITGGTHPVVVFTHGYTGTFTDYTFIFEDLASRGYVVASVDHTYEATAVEFPDGRLVPGQLGSHFDNSWHTDDKTLSFAMSVRSDDLKFVVDELERLNAAGDGPFVGKLDVSRIAVMGHSLGVLAVLSGLEQEPRFGAGVMLDGVLTDDSFAGTDKAALILAMGRKQWSDNECKLWSHLRGTRLAVNFKGAEHVTPTDAVWLAKGAIRTSAMGPGKTIAAVRDYIAAFLDANLQGKAADRLLTGPSANYPDAAVTTQKQLLCGEAIDH